MLGLVAIDMAAVVSVRNLPMMANYGWSMLVLFLFSILIFLIPVSMAAAELGTGWPEDGGIYAWVREAFGGRTGFLAVWCDYAENIPWFPTVLSFMAASLGVRVQPGAREQQVLPGDGDARVLLGDHRVEHARGEVVGDGERDRNRARFDPPRDPRGRPRRRLARRAATRRRSRSRPTR